MAATSRTQIDLKRLRYIVEVARAQSITTAAETLGLTQPALTRSIGEVETLLDKQLFHRLPRGMQLTETGEKFVSAAKQILRRVDDLIADVTGSPDQITGRLRLGISPAGWLPAARGALQQLAENHPSITIEIISGSVQELCPQLLHGEIHAVVGSSHYLTRWRDLEVRQLMVMQSGCMVRKNHPITQITDPVEADILQFPVVVAASVDQVYSELAQRYLENGLPPMQPRYITDDWDFTRALISRTDAFLPLFHPDVSSFKNEFEIIEGLLPLSEHNLALAFSSYQPKSEATELFADLMEQRYN